MTSDESANNDLAKIEQHEADSRIKKLELESELLQEQVSVAKREAEATIAKSELETQLLKERAPATDRRER